MKPSAREKIKGISELSDIAGRLHHEGKKIAHAHGTFDLLHMGHVRHLEHARREGDVLFVTVTADEHVHKGPGRPVFTDQLRAEMLAALEYVDWVGINHAVSAEEVIDAIKPDAYIKGSDYVDADQDVTGKIVDERNAVERHGGRIVFTDDITFSSSELINRHVDVFEPEVKDYLDRIRQTVGLEQLLTLVESIKDMRILVIGDTILDEYQYVSPSGQPSKENIMSTRHEDMELFAGGVIAAANHVASFCKQVDIITCLGQNDSRENFIKTQSHENINIIPVYRPNAPTTRKVRFVDNSYVRKLFEVQFIEDSPLPPESRDDLHRKISELAPQYDLVMAADFGHGLISGNTVDLICKVSPFLAVNAQTNSANRGYNLITKYPRADYICIDAPEARLAVGDRFSDLAIIAQDVLPRRIDCNRMILTHGRHGCVAYDAGKPVSQIPAFTRRVVDTMGAGDAFFSITAPLAKVGTDIATIGLIGNIAGAIKVGIVGHRNSVDKVSVVKALTALLK
ncbi:PfkB family carbohydrate kinase [Nisaea acidiphila]|uniref:PfkB family carbohydrate kinase n=1 Tax=Nisaea acidiphila TaxID=1862145 RepID=A0A9J7AN94_9PROT|nr:PfkB family carbohydrate kinase [Nisaea acidiphila]UUX48418.1 PfkB family carbohydrate kinase [Nisaea acidiphila]